MFEILGHPNCDHMCWLTKGNQIAARHQLRQKNEKYQKILIISFCDNTISGKILSFTLHCWFEYARNSKKMLAQAKHIFDTFEYF